MSNGITSCKTACINHVWECSVQVERQPQYLRFIFVYQSSCIHSSILVGGRTEMQYLSQGEMICSSARPSSEHYSETITAIIK